MLNKTNQTTTVLRPAAFAASRLPVALKCTEGVFIHVRSQFEICQAEYANGTLTTSSYEKLRDLVYMLYDVLESAIWELDIKTGNATSQTGPVNHPFEAVSAAFQALSVTFEACRQADKACTLAEAELRALFMAAERVQNVFYDLDDDETDTRPDLGHRLWLFSNPADVLGLTDTVTLMSNKADAVLTMLANMFAEEEGPRLNYDTIYYALMTVSHELADINSVVKAFHQSSKNPQQV